MKRAGVGNASEPHVGCLTDLSVFILMPERGGEDKQRVYGDCVAAEWEGATDARSTQRRGFIHCSPHLTH
jgi:hypothetical protein